MANGSELRGGGHGHRPAVRDEQRTLCRGDQPFAGPLPACGQFDRAGDRLGELFCNRPKPRYAVVLTMVISAEAQGCEQPASY